MQADSELARRAPGRMASSCPASCGARAKKPATANIPRARTRLGVVVQTMWRIWTNRFVPDMAGARFVVSESGDILSPK